MVRTQACRDKVDWLEENCPLDRTSIIPIKRASEICEKYVEISTLSTDALQPLCKVKDEEVRIRIVKKLKDVIDSGKKPTRKQVEQIAKVEELAPRRNAMIQRGKGASPHDDVTLHHGDFLQDYKKIPAGSVDCIITDPPYVKEWLHNYLAFSEAAA